MKRYLLIIFFVLLTTGTVSAKTTDNNWAQPAGTYISQKGDSWEIIAKKFNIPPGLLERFNHSKRKLSKNSRIAIPEKSIYTTKPGETALKIAIANGMTFSELIMINELTDPNSLKTGDILKIINAKTKTIVSKKKPIGTIVQDDLKNDVKLIWPAKGKVSSKFGIQPDGSHNNEIHISIDEPEIRASASGIVVYAGNQVGNYGNLIIIQHENNWFSSYSNLTNIKVQKGDNVTIGQEIAYIDTKNSSQKAELYFGLRIGVTAVNPLKYLKKTKLMVKRDE